LCRSPTEEGSRTGARLLDLRGTCRVAAQRVKKSKKPPLVMNRLFVCCLFVANKRFWAVGGPGGTDPQWVGHVVCHRAAAVQKSCG